MRIFKVFMDFVLTKIWKIYNNQNLKVNLVPVWWAKTCVTINESDVDSNVYNTDSLNPAALSLLQEQIFQV